MTALASLALATFAFVGTHLAMSHPLRAMLVKRLGERGFLGTYSLVSAAALLWMVLAWRAVEGSEPRWIAPLWCWYAASGLMLFASILLVGSLIGNPAFPKGGKQVTAIDPPAGVFTITRHPMNMSFIIWAVVHIMLWGSSRNLLVAGGILLLALAGSFGQDRKKRRMIGSPWREWERATSFVPFAALLSGRARFRIGFNGWVAMGGGLLFWLAVTSFHAPLFSPMGVIPPGIN
jgi:uncharacterized membrane protein